MPTSPERPQPDRFELLHTVPIATSAEAAGNGEGLYPAPRLAPEQYPGNRPETTGFLVDGQKVSSIRWNSESSLWVNEGEFDPVVDVASSESGIEPEPKGLDEYLRESGLTGLSDRYALTVFGSNRCPGQLEHKFRKWAESHPKLDNDALNDLSVVPAFNGMMSGYDVVYNTTLGNLGYANGNLYAGPETAETEIEVVTLFLTAAQLQVIHDSEKDYEFARVGNVKLGKLIYDDQYKDGSCFSDDMEIPAFAHIGKASVYAIPTEMGPQPVAIEDIYARDRRIPAMHQVEFQNHHLAHDPTGLKAAAFRLIQIMIDREIIDPEKFGALNAAPLARPFNRSTDPRLTGATYRNYMHIGGPAGLKQRQAFKLWLNGAIGTEEQVANDLTQSSQVEILSKATVDLPKWKDIQPRP